MKRRQFLATGSLALAGCRPAAREIEGGFTGIGFERGHRLRPAPSAAPGVGQAAPGEGLRFLNLQSLPLLFDFPLDMARVPAEVNRLSNQVLVHSYEAEWGRVTH